MSMSSTIALGLYHEAARAFADDKLDHGAQLCQRVLGWLDDMPVDGGEYDRLRVRTIGLMLWQKSQLAQKPSMIECQQLEALAIAAEEAAARTRDPFLIAHARHVHGMLYILTRGLEKGVATMREAFQLAEETGDSALMYRIGSDLGFLSGGQNLFQSLELMRRMYALYESGIADSADPLEKRLMNRQFLQLKGRMGVIMFDLGDIKGGLEWMERSCGSLAGTRLAADCYRVQPYMAMGLFEEAEVILKRVVEGKAPAEMDSWGLYNLSLLGKLYLEWGRVEDAARPLIESWRYTAPTDISWLVTLVSNYYTELLLHPDSLYHDPRRALALAVNNERYALERGWNRSVVMALVLQSQAYRATGRLPQAVAKSAEAVAFQGQFRTLPAVRAEEVLFNHGILLRESGSPTARTYLSAAYDVLLSKLASIEDEAHRQSMQERVAISRAILAEARAVQH